MVRLRELLHTDKSKPLPIPQHFLAGAGGGLVSCVVVTPIEQVKARLQVQYADPSSKVYKGPVDCVRSLVRNNGKSSAYVNHWQPTERDHVAGVLGLYKGFAGTVLFRLFMSVYFGSYEAYKMCVPVCLFV